MVSCSGDVVIQTKVQYISGRWVKRYNTIAVPALLWTYLPAKEAIYFGVILPI